MVAHVFYPSDIQSAKFLTVPILRAPGRATGMLEGKKNSLIPGVPTSARVQREDDVSWRRGELPTEFLLPNLGVE
jgi:hypothetical protein